MHMALSTGQAQVGSIILGSICIFVALTCLIVHHEITAITLPQTYRSYSYPNCMHCISD